MAISVIALVVAIVALVVNVSGLIRRPRIVAKWGEVAGDHEYGPRREGLSVIVTARRRTVELDEVGVVLLPKPPLWWRRHFPEWLHEDQPFRFSLRTDDDLPKRLEDGQSLRAFIDLDDAIERPGGRSTTHACAYIRASGTVYLARENSKLQKWLRNGRGYLGSMDLDAAGGCSL